MNTISLTLLSRRLRCALLASATVGLSPTLVAARPDPAPPSDPFALLSHLPPTVDAAAILDRPGERFWSDPSGRAARDALARTGMFSQTQRAWSGLAEALGYTDDEAAAALLGRRVLIAWDALAGEDAQGPLGAAARADTRWAVVAEVSGDTAKLVRTRLRAAPRRTIGGRVVYSIDAGRTAMAVVEEDGEARVLIAPNAAAPLLDSLLGVRPGPTTGASVPAGDPPAAETPSLAERARAVLGNVEPGWTAVVAVRPDSSEDPGVVELRSAAGAWGLRLAVPSADSDADTGVPVGVLAEVGGDALLAAAFAGGPTFGPGSMDLGLRLGPARADRTDDAPLRTGRGLVLMLRAQDDASETGPRAVAQMITHAEADDAFAEQADRLISAMIGGQNPPEHRGRFPSAVRTHRLPPDPSRSSEATPTWPGPDAEVSWCLSPDAADRSGVISMAVAPAGIDPGPAARKGREAWDRHADDTDPTMLSAGTAQPAALSSLFPPRRRGPLGTLAASIDRVDWTVRLRDGVTRGEVLMRFTTPPTRLGKP